MTARPWHARGRVAAWAAGALFVALALAPARVPAEPAIPTDNPALVARVAPLIPDGPVTVDMLAPKVTPEMEAVSRRLMNAAQANPKWFQEWVAAHPRPPLPWHPNLGVSRPEYERYLEQSKHARFQTTYRARLTFQRMGRTHRWTLHGWGQLGPLEGLTIDLDQDTALSPRWGVLPGLGLAEPNEPGVAMPWQWYAVWKAAHTMGDPRTSGQAATASLHIGPVGDGSAVGLYWVARRFNRGRRLADEFVLLRYPRPGR